MPSEIPEYYRQFAEKPPPPAPAASGKRTAVPATAPFDPAALYLANTFMLGLAEDWQDRTLHIIAGPVTDDMQHSILVDVEPEVGTDDLVDYADWQVKALEEDLKGCRLLLQEPIQLANGLPAYRAIFCWYPAEDVRIYQEQVYVLHENTGYKLTASFTKKTRKTLGPQVERMMLSFSPGAPAVQSPARAVRAY